MKINKKIQKWVIIICLIFAGKHYLSSSADIDSEINKIVEKISNNVESGKEVIASIKAENKSRQEGKNKMDGITVETTGVSETAAFFMDKAVETAIDFMHSPLGQKIVETALLTSPDENGILNIADFNNWHEGPYHNNTNILISTGKGEDAKCGQKLLINYQATNLGTGQILAQSKNIELRLGDKKILPGIEYLLMGMRKNGIRTAILPPKFAYGYESSFFEDDLSKTIVLSRAEILDIKSPKLDLSGFMVISQKSFGGNFALCGSTGIIQYQLFNGNKPISDKLISKEITLGDPNLPIAINIGLDGISDEEERVIVLTANTATKSFDGKNVNFFPQDFLKKSRPIIKITNFKHVNQHEDDDSRGIK